MTMPGDWAPDDCTLPTAERPLRVAEFDEFFTVVLRFDRPQPTRLDLVLPRDAEATDRYLADRESECCSFFTFGFEPDGGRRGDAHRCPIGSGQDPRRD